MSAAALPRDPRPWTKTPNNGGLGYRTDREPWFSEEPFYFEPRDGYSQNPSDYQ